jgi:hypothetical protein
MAGETVSPVRLIRPRRAQIRLVLCLTSHFRPVREPGAGRSLVFVWDSAAAGAMEVDDWVQPAD